MVTDKLHSQVGRILKGEEHLYRLEIPEVTLTIEAGPDHPRSWTLSHSPIRIGTHPDNDVVLSDTSTSRFHAQVAVTAEGLSVKDLGSTNGTRLRGVRVAESELPDGEVLAMGRTKLRIELRREHVTSVAVEPDRMGPFVGKSAAMQEVFSLLTAAGSTSAPIHICGESGTGKEVAARFVHETSGRRGELVTFDCGRVQAELIGSELFGHKKGAFTGAQDNRPGAFRAAHRGTLFLDELGELPLALQPNLLRALETREVQPLGHDGTVPVDVRIVTATNRDLESMVRSGQFRRDLFYRLSVISVRLPPLRERTEDVPVLLRHFQDLLEIELRLPGPILDQLVAHPWPGNVRELRNVVERLGIVTAGREVTKADLAFMRTEEAAALAGGPPNLEDVERRSILETYERMGRNKFRTAQALGISRNRLKRKLKEYLGDIEDD